MVCIHLGVHAHSILNGTCQELLGNAHQSVAKDKMIQLQPKIPLLLWLLPNILCHITFLNLQQMVNAFTLMVHPLEVVMDKKIAVGPPNCCNFVSKPKHFVHSG